MGNKSTKHRQFRREFLTYFKTNSHSALRQHDEIPELSHNSPRKIAQRTVNMPFRAVFIVPKTSQKLQDAPRWCGSGLTDGQLCDGDEDWALVSPVAGLEPALNLYWTRTIPTGAEQAKRISVTEIRTWWWCLVNPNVRSYGSRHGRLCDRSQTDTMRWHV